MKTRGVHSAVAPARKIVRAIDVNLLFAEAPASLSMVLYISCKTNGAELEKIIGIFSQTNSHCNHNSNLS
jgi:hypothetical protein